VAAGRIHQLSLPEFLTVDAIVATEGLPEHKMSVSLQGNTTSGGCIISYPSGSKLRNDARTEDDGTAFDFDTTGFTHGKQTVTSPNGNGVWTWTIEQQ